eukprot:Selendium_serpulae@DN3987_c0_g1_i1.p1
MLLTKSALAYSFVDPLLGTQVNTLTEINPISIVGHEAKFGTIGRGDLFIHLHSLNASSQCQPGNSSLDFWVSKPQLGRTDETSNCQFEGQFGHSQSRQIVNNGSLSIADRSVQAINKTKSTLPATHPFT